MDFFKALISALINGGIAAASGHFSGAPGWAVNMAFIITGILTCTIYSQSKE